MLSVSSEANGCEQEIGFAANILYHASTIVSLLQEMSWHALDGKFTSRQLLTDASLILAIACKLLA